MRAHRRAVLLVPALALVAPLPARATAPPVAGHPCAVTTVSWETAGPGSYGEVDGGPVLLGDPAGPPVTGRITCTLQVWPDSRHADPDGPSATSPTTPLVAVLAPTVVTFEADPEAEVYLCTRVDVDGGGTWYWEALTETEGRWTGSAEARCPALRDLLPVLDPGPQPLPDNWIDQVLCPVLALALPPQGDVPGVWDCPPYGG